MIKCQPQPHPTKPGWWQCANCGFEDADDAGHCCDRIHRICTTDLPPEQRTITQKLSAYATALAKWIAAGRPMRTAEQIEATMQICRGCKHFEATADDTNGCKKCGCKKTLGIGGLRQKISWATEECPAGKW
jgi:hypothetical protein